MYMRWPPTLRFIKNTIEFGGGLRGFRRAVCGEWYALWRRRAIYSLLLLIVATLLRAAAAALWERATNTSGDSLQATHANFWPRFAEAARFGLILAEVLTLVIVSGNLPREIASASVRDPLTRRISRSGFMAAKWVLALFIPLLFGFVAVCSAALWSRCWFRPGPIVDEPILYLDDPDATLAYQEFLDQHDLRPEHLAEWYEMTENGTDPREAQRTLGLEPFTLPEGARESWPIPFLVRSEREIRNEVMRGLIGGLPSLLASGLLALTLSVLFGSVLLAVASSLGFVMLAGVFLPPGLGQGSTWWAFPIWLPGMGQRSTLERAQRLADGYSDVVALVPSEVAASWQAPAIAGLLFLLLSQLAFVRKPL